jgi:hypothetical protein
MGPLITAILYEPEFTPLALTFGETFTSSMTLLLYGTERADQAREGE